MSAGFPGIFDSSESTGYLNIGAVQKQRTAAGFPGTVASSESTGYVSMGAVQKPDPITATMAATYTPGYTFAATATFTAPSTGETGGRGPRQFGGRRPDLLPNASDTMRIAVLSFPYI